MTEKKFVKAKVLYEHYGEAIIHDNGISEVIEKYRQSISSTRELMQEVGIIEDCTVCSREENGSCCYQGVEAWYDHILLFINLLLGADISGFRDIYEGCLFVGSKGCMLLARHSFCVNYLCPSIKRRLERSQTERFISVAGAELFLGWELERSIRSWIHIHDRDFS